MEQVHLATNALAPPGPGTHIPIVFVKAAEVLFLGTGWPATLSLWQAGCPTTNFEATYRKCQAATRRENWNDGDEGADSLSHRAWQLG